MQEARNGATTQRRNGPGGGNRVAFETRLAAALSGATVRQLTYWRRQEILVPEVSAQRVVLYSFRDVVAARTVTYLRDSRSLHSIRKALNGLRLIGESGHLSSYKLVPHGKRGISLVDGGRALDLVDQPGQILLSQVFGSFPAEDIEVPNLFTPRPLISVNPDVRGGHPVVKDTRVPFDVVADLVRDGVGADDVQEFFPSVTADAARDAVSYADYVDRNERRQAA
jgi:uncharacterized protein (DUF433 family)/DNA-binding transcriptional MerR regulator